MFEFSIECAKVMLEMQFILRLHPIIRFKALLDQNPKLRKLPKNILLSKKTIPKKEHNIEKDYFTFNLDFIVLGR